MGGGATALSHWDKRVMGNELMTGTTSPTDVTLGLSPMTLAFFEDSGHYDVDYRVCSEPAELSYGRAAGCGFIEQRCDTVVGGRDRYFCWKDNTFGCTTDRLGAGICLTHSYPFALPESYQYFPGDAHKGGVIPHMDFCPTYVGDSNTLCVNEELGVVTSGKGNIFSVSSRCFETSGEAEKEGGFRSQHAPSTYANRISPRCFETRCPGGTRVELRVAHTTDWLRCPLNGSAGDIAAPDGYVGIIHCPPASDICTRALSEGADLSEASYYAREGTQNSGVLSQGRLHWGVYGVLVTLWVLWGCM